MWTNPVQLVLSLPRSTYTIDRGAGRHGRTGPALLVSPSGNFFLYRSQYFVLLQRRFSIAKKHSLIHPHSIPMTSCAFTTSLQCRPTAYILCFDFSLLQWFFQNYCSIFITRFDIASKRKGSKNTEKANPRNVRAKRMNSANSEGMLRHCWRFCLTLLRGCV